MGRADFPCLIIESRERLFLQPLCQMKFSVSYRQAGHKRHASKLILSYRWPQKWRGTGRKIDETTLIPIENGVDNFVHGAIELAAITLARMASLRSRQ